MGERVCYILCTFLMKNEIIKKGKGYSKLFNEYNCIGVLWLEFLKKYHFATKWKL